MKKMVFNYKYDLRFREYCIILVSILTSLCFCKSKGENQKAGSTGIVTINLDQVVNSLDPFCEFHVSDDKKLSFPVEKNLRFTPVEAREINMEDEYLHHLIHRPLLKSEKDKITFLYGSRNNQKVICFDTNNDGRFEDEKVYQISENMPFIKISNLQSFANGNNESRAVFIRPTLRSDLIINANQDTDPANFHLSFFMMPFFNTGEIMFDHNVYKFALFNYSTERLYTSTFSRLVITEKDSSFLPCLDHQVQYRVGDTIHLSNKIFLFDSVFESGNRVNLRELRTESKQLGIDRGYYAFPLISEDLLSGKYYSTDTINKLILLDFWGTWCKPCIASTPVLKEIESRYKNSQFQIISIANDKSKDVVKKYLVMENINWVNFFDDSNNDVLCNKFKIQAYPTFILIGPDKKILFRASGTAGLDSIKKILSEKF